MTRRTWLLIVIGAAQVAPAMALESMPALSVERSEIFWQEQPANGASSSAVQPGVLEVPAAVPDITQDSSVIFNQAPALPPESVERAVQPEPTVQRKSAGTMIRFLAQGMSSHSSTAVEGQLKKLPGVLDVVADWKPGMVTVFFDGSQVEPGAFYTAVSQMGFYVEPLIEPTVEYAETGN